MKKLILIFGLLVLLAVPAASFASPGIDVEAAVGGWMQSFTGDLSYIPGVAGASDILDLEDDLKYDDEIQVIGRVKLEWPVLPNIYVMAALMDFKDDGQKDFQFGNINIDGTLPFDSVLTLNQYDLSLYYGIPALETATTDKLNIDIGLNARFIEMKAEVTQGTLSDSESSILPIPSLFVAAQFRPIDEISIEAEGRGVAVGNDKVLSIIGRLKLKVMGPLFIAGGFRHDTIDIDESDILLDTTFSGIFLEAGLGL